MCSRMRGAAEMTTWEPMPTVVWDTNGNKWVYELFDDVWKSNELCASTVDLLDDFGPVTDTRPIKVGDAVSLEEFVNLPEGSITACVNGWPLLTGTEGRFWQAGAGAVYSAARAKEILRGPVVVLRIGWGEQE